MALTKLNYTGQGTIPIANIPTITSAKMPSDTILQVKKVTWTAQFTTAATTYTDITQATLNFTPIVANSTLKITAFFHAYFGKGSSEETGGAFQMLHNGSVVEATYQEEYRKKAGSGTAILQLPHVFSNYVASGNTNARTIKAQTRCMLGASEMFVNKGGNYTSHIEVMEIKG